MASDDKKTNDPKVSSVDADSQGKSDKPKAVKPVDDAASTNAASASESRPAAPKGAATRAKTTASRKAAATSKSKKSATARGKTAASTAGKPATKRSAAKSAANKTAAPAKTTASKKDTALTQSSGPATDITPESQEDNASAIAQLTEKMMDNLASAENLIQRLATAMAGRRPPNPGIEGPGLGFFAQASQDWLRTMTEHPGRLLGQQAQFWAETMKHYAEVQAALSTGKLQAPDYSADNGRDRRFSNPLWRTHPYFSFIRRQYEITADAMRKATANMEVADPVQRQRLDWFTNQLIDMMAPTNFFATNPDALERAIETEGESLVRGLQNLVDDVEQGGGDIVVTLADRDAFKIGENIATAPGEVVVRRPLYELIQFAPSTDEVHSTPIVLFPPWINKFYILDLKPENSFIRWVVDQGFTLYVMSWKNPGPDDGDIGLEDYVEAYIDAMENVRIITEQQKLNVIGYCIGGTTLALTLSLLKQRGQDKDISSATFFTTLTDFSDLGEFTPFLQDDFIDGIEAEIRRVGILGAPLMSRTFSFLRANDLVWGPAIRSYMLGDPPPAFDLLFWNGDSTNLPGRMALQYLRGLCQQNQFADDGFELLGHKLHLSDVTLPVCSIACQTDHIAPWIQCWHGFSRLNSTDKTFIMTESGHIAGIVNPPSKKKYGHYLSDAGFAGTPEDWLAAAKRHDGSWWPVWRDWIAPRSGQMVPARIPEGGIASAPGTYVKEAAILP